MKIFKNIVITIIFLFIPFRCLAQLDKLRTWVVFFHSIKESIILVEEEARLKELHKALKHLHNNEKILFFALQFMKDKFQIQSQVLATKLSSSNYLTELQKRGLLDDNQKIKPLVPIIIEAAFKLKNPHESCFLTWNMWKEEITKPLPQDIKKIKIKMRQEVHNEIMKYLQDLDDKTRLALYTVSNKIASSSLSEKDAQEYFKIISTNQDLEKIPIVIQQLAVRLITIETDCKSPKPALHKAHKTDVESNNIELLD